MTFDATRVKQDFPALSQVIRGGPLVYLDSAATSQKPRAVLEALDRFYSRDNSNVHRGVHALAERATAAFEEARAKVASFIGAPDPATVIWTRGTTEAVNLVAYAWARKFLRPEDEIVLTLMEHHSNLVPWQLAAQDTGARLRFVPVKDDFTLDLERYRELLNPKTKLVAFTHVSNVLGTVSPARAMIADAHRVGACVLVDAAQSVPHMPVDVTELDCDFLTVSGHKMLGPTGIGILYGKREALQAAAPFHGGGEMILEVTPERSTYKPIPYKFEAGTPPIAEAVGLGAAVDYLRALDMNAVRAHEIAIAEYALDALAGAGGVRVYGPRQNRGGAVSFGVEGIHAHDLATILDGEGIAVRAGHHCAQPLMQWLQVPATARASFYVYNTRDDVDALVHGIEKAKRVFGLARQAV